MASGGKLLLRVLLGALILLHGIAKLKTGVGPVAGMLTEHGVPGEMAYLVYVGEVAAPLMMIAGVWTRLAGLVVAVNMIVAISLAHVPQLAQLNEQGGWAIELQAMYLGSALAVMLLGAGRFSAGGALGRWN
ncbi:DoxX family protein [Pelomonas sp. KK5]|uniref:DoxX family protein n=1 Tax=Pelomonas sp. KK5 TaxID=1855730 RepID=UPI00097C97DF|nr:DoxX family protein [Pelomonas sp. KK5]